MITIQQGRPITREVLTAARTYYVRTDGSNSNNGLTNTSGGAFLTVQKAVDTVATLDIGTNNVTIQVADGTYSSGETLINGPWVGSGVVTIQGNTGTPANVLISTTSTTSAIRCINGGSITLSGMEIRTTTGGQGLYAQFNGAITIGSSMRFGACANSHCYAEAGGIIYGRTAYTISGSPGNCHYQAAKSGYIDVAGLTVTITGTINWGTAFAHASNGGFGNHVSMAFSTGGATITGTRFQVLNGGIIATNGGGASYFPGNAAGTGTNLGTSPYGMYS